MLPSFETQGSITRKLCGVVFAWFAFVPCASVLRAATSSAASPVIVVDTRNPFDVWVLNHGLAGGDALLQGTPGGDGVTNLLKFAFNMNPLDSDTREVGPFGAGGLPAVEIREVDGLLRLHLRVIRRKDDSSLAYTAEFSDTPADWNLSSFATVPIEVTSLDAVWERVVYRDPVPGPVASRRFGRVMVSFPTP